MISETTAGWWVIALGVLGVVANGRQLAFSVHEMAADVREFRDVAGRSGLSSLQLLAFNLAFFLLLPVLFLWLLAEAQFSFFALSLTAVKIALSVVHALVWQWRAVLSLTPGRPMLVWQWVDALLNIALLVALVGALFAW